MLIRSMLSKSMAFAMIIFVMSSCSSSKTGYVDVFKLVQEFELQKEYTDAAKKELEKEKSLIDSLVYVERIRNSESNDELKNELYTRLYMKSEEKNKEIEKMIWERLNPYLVDYGKENKYTFILGANGTANVLYADEKMDITDELIEYVNKRYHDKK